MNTQKGFAPVLLILLAVVVIGGGGYFYTQNKETAQITIDTVATSTADIKTNPSVPQPIVNTTNTSVSISDQTIIQALSTAYEVALQKNSRGIYEAKFPPDMRSNVVVNKIVKADLNNDGKQDAFVWNTVCGASCASEFSLVLNGATSALRTGLPGFTTVGAGQMGIKDISVNQGVLIVIAEIPSSDGSPTSSKTFQYKLSGDNFVVLNETQQIPMILSTEEARTLVIQTWGDCTSDSCSKVVVSIEQKNNQWYVTATYEGLRDDSSSAQRKVALATYINNKWVLGVPTITQSCQKNRGHQDFSAELCL